MCLSTQRLTFSNSMLDQNPKFSLYTALKPKENSISIFFQCKANVKTSNHVSAQAKTRNEFRDKYFPDAKDEDDSHLGIRVSMNDFDQWYQEHLFLMYTNPSQNYEPVSSDFNTIRRALQLIGARVPIQFVGFVHRIHKEYPDLPRLSRQQLDWLLNNWEDDVEKHVLRKYRQRCEKDASNAYNESAGTWKLVVAFIEKIVTLYRGSELTRGALLNLAMATKVQSLWMKGKTGTNPYALVCSKGRKQKGFQKYQDKWECNDERQFSEEIVEWKRQTQANLDDQTLEIEAKIESECSESEVSFDTPSELNSVEQAQHNWDIIFQKAFDQPTPGQRMHVSQEMITRLLIDLQVSSPNAFVEQYDLNDPDISNNLEKMKTIQSHFQDIHQESNYSCAQLYCIVKSICEQFCPVLENVQVKEEHDVLSLPLPLPLPLPPMDSSMECFTSEEMNEFSREPVHTQPHIYGVDSFSHRPPPVYHYQEPGLNYEPGFSYPVSWTQPTEPIGFQQQRWDYGSYGSSSFNYPQGFHPQTQQWYPNGDQYSAWPPPPSFPFPQFEMNYPGVVSPSFAPQPACTSQFPYLSNSVERNQLEQQSSLFEGLPMHLHVEKEPDRSKMDVDKDDTPEWATWLN